MLAEGDRAIDFELPGDDGLVIKLSRLKGKPVVVYFYPKDDTSGCTAEAKDFSALKAGFDKAGVEIVGIAPGTAASKARFRRKHDLTIRLAADETQSTLEAYGVWTEKSMYGRTYMGVERSTFLIDKSGKVAKVWRKVKVPGHAAEVLAAAKALAK
jgi:peroxiredoxin Q/BCP